MKAAYTKILALDDPNVETMVHAAPYRPSLLLKDAPSFNMNQGVALHTLKQVTATLLMHTGFDGTCCSAYTFPL